MATTTSTGGVEAPSEGLRAALLTLLADEDPKVAREVRARILACGEPARAWLQPHALSADPLLRRRVAEILNHLSRQRADSEFLAFCLARGAEFDLEDGVWLLARTHYPEINVAAYRALLDSYAEDIRERLGPEERSTVGCLSVINDQLFNELGFHGNESNYYDPENSFLNRVLDRRTGNPISLATLYWLVARRLKLPVVGVSLPRHFLCRYQNATETVFIDAFNRGKLLTRADCVRFLQQIGEGFQEGHLAAATPNRALVRVCANLQHIYHELGHEEEAARFQRYAVALSRHGPRAPQ